MFFRWSTVDQDDHVHVALGVYLTFEELCRPRDEGSPLLVDANGFANLALSRFLDMYLGIVGFSDALSNRLDAGLGVAARFSIGRHIYKQHLKAAGSAA